jgi:cell division protein FtsQ
VNTDPNIQIGSKNQLGRLIVLVACALFLSLRLLHSFLADAERFPINTVKVSASYQHLSHEALQQVLAKYTNLSFFTIPLSKLQNELNQMPWIDSARLKRTWPDTLTIKITEKKPVAFWGKNNLMTVDGSLFKQDVLPQNLNIPHLSGPNEQKLEVLQVYEKLSKILARYDLKADKLKLSADQAWILFLPNDIKIFLGKKELATRLERFCRAYPAVFAQKRDQLASVDLRYSRGMAVQWKQQLGQ